MTPSKTTCDPAVIERLLGDRLAEDERRRVETHLEQCAACRTRLERLAADPDEWSEARAFLSSADEILPEHGSAGSSACGHGAWRSEDDLPRADLILSYLTASDEPRMLGRLAGYEIAGVIGHGGMGVVLKGLDVALNRYVAIKVLAPHLATSAAARLRFAREARAAAAVVHENVIAIHAVSEANGLPYLVMPYVRGTSLQKRLDAQGPLSATEIARIGMQAAAGLAAAHAQGLVHRDIKPANILLEDGVERLKITDFGLARAADDASLTRSGVIAGTPQFMSPEQARGDSIDRRSDLFSLGSVLYSLCTGHPPFRAETSYGVLRRISDDHPRPIREQNPEIPEWLCALIDTLHAKSPAERYPSAEAVSKLFEQCLAHLQQPTIVPLPETVRRRRLPRAASPRRRLRFAGNALALFLLPAALIWIVWYSGSARSQRTVPVDARSDRDASATANVSRSTEVSFQRTSGDPVYRWEDDTTAGIVELENEIAAAEAMFEEGWDAPPVEVERSQPRAIDSSETPSDPKAAEPETTPETVEAAPATDVEPNGKSVREAPEETP